MSLTISAASKEYVKVEVTAVKNGAAYNPTADTVEFAFTTSDDLDGASWKAASWETLDGHYFARCLVGPGGTTELTEDIYITWVRVTDNPEIPVKRAGTLKVI